VAGEVHVWRIDLDSRASSVAALRAILSQEELEKTARFRTAELSQKWTVARGALRYILGAYTGSDPRTLVLRAGRHGTPELVGPGEDISFNLSHTHSLALLAVASSGRVGIDAETVRPVIEAEDLSRRFFATAEADEILALAPAVRLAAFFACWTRKEAFVKALGSGLSSPFHGFRVTVRADQVARLISVDRDEPERWSLVDLSEAGVAAALAVEGPAPVLRHFDFVPPLTQESFSDHLLSRLTTTTKLNSPSLPNFFSREVQSRL
jgi:4'-phosphopantetheinyl transferase